MKNGNLYQLFEYSKNNVTIVVIDGLLAPTV
jgi:hypothetical protein